MNKKYASLVLLALVAIGISLVFRSQDADSHQATSEDARGTPELYDDYEELVAIAIEPVTSTEPTRKSVEQSRLTVVDGSSVEDETAATGGTTVVVEIVNESGVLLEGCVVDAAFQYIDPVTGKAAGKELHWSGSTSSNGLVMIPVKAWPLEASCQIQVTARSKMNEIASSSLALAHGDERRIRLKVLNAISCFGRVFSSSDRMPLAGISVIARSHGIQCSAITDDSGAFSVPLVSRPGSGSISFEAESISNEIVDTTIEANGSWTASIWEQEGRKLLTLDSLPMYFEVSLSPARAVTGVIKSWEGKPVPGASVTLLGYYTKLPGVFTPDRGSAISNEVGYFEINGLRGDINHLLDIKSDGFAGVQIVVRPDYDADGRAVDLGEISLEPEIEIQGRVTDSSGVPAEGLVVLAKLLGQRKTHQSSSAKPQSKQRRTPVVMWPDFSARVDSDGHYLLPGRQSGRYYITILDESGRAMLAYFNGAIEEAFGIEIEVDSNKNTINVTLDQKEQSISGNVKLPARWDGGYVELTHVPSMASRRVSINSDGGYTISGVEIGSTRECTLTAFVLIGESIVLVSPALTLDEVASGRVLEFTD